MLQDWTGVSTFDPKEAETFSDDPLFVRAAARAVAVLSAFEHAYKPLSLNEIALSGVDRSAAQRMVHTLQALDLITRDDEDRGYLPGKRILTMAYSYLRLNPVAQKATPVLLELRCRTRERVDMSFWDDTRLIYALRMPSKHEIFTATLIGNAVPVYCTAGGLAVLSCLPDAEIADIFERSPRMSYTTETFTTLAEDGGGGGRPHARPFHRLGAVAATRAGDGRAGVRDGQGRPLGAIHLAGSLEEHSVEEFSAKFGSLLEQAGRTVSGFR